MKKIIKSRIFIFVFTAVIFTGVGVYAANTYKASDVVYNASDGTSMNVNEALNELYNKTSCTDSNIDIIKNFSMEKETTLYTSNKNIKLGYIIMELNSISIPNSSTGTITFSKSVDDGNITISRNKVTGSGTISLTGSLYVSNNIQFFKSATSTNYTATVDCTSIKNYEELTEDNFLIDMRSFKISGTSGSTNFHKKYDSSTGKLTVSRGSLSGTVTAVFNIDVYIKK